MPTVRREPLTPFDGRYAEPITVGNEEIEKLWEIYALERAMLAWEEIKTNTQLVVVLTPVLFTIVRAYIMKDWKTTVTGVVKAVFSVLTIFGISTGNLTEALITAFIAAGVEIVQSILTPDKK